MGYRPQNVARKHTDEGHVRVPVHSTSHLQAGTRPVIVQLYHGLYSTGVDDEALVQCNASRARYQFQKEHDRDIDMHHYFVLSHSKRLLINAWKIEKEAHSKYAFCQIRREFISDYSTHPRYVTLARNRIDWMCTHFK